MVISSGTGKRRRAPAMDPEQRREAIIQATLPLLAEHGVNVTTNQIATAAGIAEGTVFRVFTDKRELLRACMDTALRFDGLLDEVSAVPRDAPVREQLTGAVSSLGRHLSRVGAVLGALSAAGYQHADDKDRDKEADQPLRPLFEAITALLRRDAFSLWLPPERAARLLVSLTIAEGIEDPRTVPTTDHVAEVVTLFLHGAFTSESHSGGHQP